MELIVFIFFVYCIYKVCSVLFSMAGGCLTVIVKLIVALVIMGILAGLGS
jgi:hypothetical protein